MKTNLFSKDLAVIYAVATVNRYVSRKLFTLHAIATLPAPTMVDIQQATKISIPALSRIIYQLRNEDGINIIYQREKGADGKDLPRGKSGYYFIESWGPLDSESFLSTFEQEASEFLSPQIKTGSRGK